MPTLFADPHSLAESPGRRLARAESSRSSGTVASRLKAWFPASPRAIATNYAAAASLILLGYAFYATVPYATELTRAYYDGLIPPASWPALRVVVVAYLLLLPLYYATFSDDHTVKCRRFWQGLSALRDRRPTPEEAIAFRAIAVKAIFWPVMIDWLQLQAHDLTASTEAFLSFGRFFPYGYCAIYHGLFVVDVLLFAIGYGVEHPWLQNEIRSVEPTLLGWLAALMCYPPLVWLTSNVLRWFSSEVPHFRSPTLQVAAGVAMLLGIAVYAWATLALGLRASNLTNRGIVTTGPYRWLRHPAYVAKNLSWWIGAIPLLIKFAFSDPGSLALAIAGTAAWSGIYVLRALTEERHLGSDPDYQVYRSRVRWRFIPGLV
jgi:protein-S-isoprenylcysteine O-methyltransferase Ste14